MKNPHLQKKSFINTTPFPFSSSFHQSFPPPRPPPKTLIPLFNPDIEIIIFSFSILFFSSWFESMPNPLSNPSNPFYILSTPSPKISSISDFVPSRPPSFFFSLFPLFHSCPSYLSNQTPSQKKFSTHPGTKILSSLGQKIIKSQEESGEKKKEIHEI